MYSVGDLALLACEFATSGYGSWHMCPGPARFAVGSASMNAIIWTEVRIRQSRGNSSFPYEVVHKEDNSCAYFVQQHLVNTNLRPHPLSKTISAVTLTPMAHSCLECKTQFMYPVEYNLPQGRLCFSCKSQYGWKYEAV